MQSIRAGWSRFVALTETHRKLTTVVTLAIGAIPAWCALSWVLQYGVDIPIKDDWDMTPVVVKAQTGRLTFADLFQQQQEARMILPALVFALSAAGGHWNVRALMVLSVVTCVVTAGGIYWLLLRSGLRFWAAALGFWIAAAVIFSAAQFELWVWASGFPSFLPAMFLVLALVAVQTELSITAKFAICFVCSVAASFTLSHGLLLWGLTFPVLLLGGGVRRWGRWLCGWIAAIALCAAVYFYDYRKPGIVPEFAPSISALDYVRYFLAFLGGEFTFSVRENRGAIAIAAGALLLAIFLAALVLSFVRRRDAAQWRQRLPWFALGGYSLGAAGLATLGRVGFGFDSALSSRYVTFSLYLTVAVVVLVALAGQRLWNAQISAGATAAFWATSLGLLAAAAFLYHAAHDRCVRFMQASWADTRSFRSAVMFSHAIDTSDALQRPGNPPPEVLRGHAAALDELKLLRPRLVRGSAIEPIASPESGAATGKLESVTPVDEKRLRAGGFAQLVRERRSADAVLLAYETAERGWNAFEISDAVVKSGNRHQGWTATFPRDVVPAGARISAWALDADAPKLYRLEQNIESLAGSEQP